MREGPLLMLTVLCFSPLAAAVDAHEVAPHRVTSEIAIGFGSEPHQLAPRSPEWGRQEVGTFGPFTIDREGKVYVADTKGNAVKVFTRAGEFERSIPMLKNPNLVDHLAVCNEELYWLGESMFGLAVYRLDLKTGDTLRVALADDPQFSIIRDGDSRRTHGLVKLDASGDEVSIVHTYRGFRLPLAVRGEMLSPALQVAAKSIGSMSGRPAIGFTTGDEYTTSGEYTRGDLVLLDELGRPGKIIVRNSSPGQMRGRYVFVIHQEPGSGIYRDVRTLEGQLVSRTLSRWRMADNLPGRDIDLANEYELQKDGTFYQLYLVEEGGRMECRVAHWAGGGR